MSYHHHNHDHHSHELSEQNGSGNLKLAFWLNAAFALIEIAGGIMTNSIAVLSDALHDAGDTVAIGVAWYFHHISGRQRDEEYSFGYKRFTVLGALINSLILLTGSVIILYNAIPRILHPEPVNSNGMLLLAILGILVNSLAMMKVSKGKSQNEKVISLHLLEDVLGWVAVLIVSVVLYFKDIPVLDPLLSVGITLYILFRLYYSLRQTFRILLQGTPGRDWESMVLRSLIQIKDVKSIHDLHIWTLDGNYHIASLHIVVDMDFSLSETETLKNTIRSTLHDLKIEHATLEIELQGNNCSLTNC